MGQIDIEPSMVQLDNSNTSCKQLGRNIWRRSQVWLSHKLYSVIYARINSKFYYSFRYVTLYFFNDNYNFTSLEDKSPEEIIRMIEPEIERGEH